MKKNILFLIVAVVLWQAGTASAAITPQITFSQATNAVLSWPSTPGDSFMVLHRAAFHPSTPWRILATNLPAGPFNLTTFTHVGAYRILPGMVITGTGGGGSPPGSPAAATLAAPTTDTSTTTTDKVKKKDEGPPALPDEKELEKQYREWLKEWEKQQKNNGGGNAVQTFSATATYTLPDASYTNFTGGFYVITRTTDDTDGDGLPDWWEATHGLNLLVNDAAEDPDGDGVPNLAEYAYGTDPHDPNSKPVVYVNYTSPVNTNTYFPVVQITGSINLNVRTVLFDVSNAAGVQTGLEGFVTQRTVIPGSGFTNSPSRYTNSFQCFDVPLTNGANIVTLHFADPYGLTFTTTVSFTVDFNASPAAPVGTVFWPANGAKIGTDTFTLRGRLDNPTASVVAQMTIDGEEQEIGGLVERDGTFWIEDLPTPASGSVTLVFTDAGGKATTNTLNLTRSPVSLSLYDPSGPNLWDSTMSLNGIVSDPTYSVWVNSTRATVDESGNWSAENVPLNAGGVGSFAVRAVPNSDNGGAGSGGQAMSGSGGQGGLYSPPTGNPGSASAVDAAFDFDKPPRIVVSSYTMRSQEDNPTFEYGSTNRATLDWTRNGAGYSGAASSYYEMKYPPYYSPVWRQTQSINYPFPGTNGYEFTTGIYAWGDPFSYTNLVGEPGIPWEQANAYLRTSDRNFARKAETQLAFQTGGRSGGRTSTMFEFGLSVSATDAQGNPFVVLPQQVSLFGETADTNYAVLKVDLPLNTTLDATPVIQLAANASGGAIVNYSYGEQGAVLQGISPLRYANPIYTNGVVRSSFSRDAGIYLGYGSCYAFYAIRQGEILDGILHQASSSANRYSIVRYGPPYPVNPKTIRFLWDGTILPFDPPEPTFSINLPVLNSRRFAYPKTDYAAQVRHWRYSLHRTNTLGSVKMIAKAAMGSVQNVQQGDYGHLADVRTAVEAMGYTVTQDTSLRTNAANGLVEKSLICYFYAHGVHTPNSSGGEKFLGLKDADGRTLTPDHVPPNVHCSILFFNGCLTATGDSASDPNPNPNDPSYSAVMAGFMSRLKPDVYVGWNVKVDGGIAASFAKKFFAHLALGETVDTAKTAAINEMGNPNAGIGQPQVSECIVTVAYSASGSAGSGGGVMVDLRK